MKDIGNAYFKGSYKHMIRTIIELIYNEDDENIQEYNTDIDTIFNEPIVGDACDTKKIKLYI
jgi:hypothetical protein